MRKAKTVNKNVFESLSREQQEQELKKMAKRANVRMSLLEETGINNEVYLNAQRFITNQDRKNGKFSEGTNYKSAKDIKETFNALSNFLNNKKSTLSGIEADTNKKVDNMIKNGQFDMNTLRGMSDKELTYVAKESAKIANKRLGQLEKADIDYYAYGKAQHYNEATGRKNNRFYRGGKFDSKKDIMIHIQNVYGFLNSESSTPKGVKNIHDRRIETFRQKGLNIPKGKEEDFYNFLTSEQFTNLGKYADSNQVLDLFVDARNAKIDSDKINKEFEDYLNTDIDLDTVRERLKIAKWKKGGLLK